MQTATTDQNNKIKDFSSPTPINRESRFEYNELFFSITDQKSTITYANDVFVRISKYNADNIVGQLHKLIRHPDMPRSVFYEFWDHLKKDKPVAAYVKNMSKDGSYYWVMALAFPCDGGYLSVRLKPGSDLFNKIKDIYKTVLDHERKQESISDKKTAMRSSHALFVTELKNIGFSSYDEFMWNALQSEMENRESILESTGDANKRTGEYIPDELLEVEKILRELVLALGQLRQIHTSLVGHSDYILKLSRSVLLLSKNAQISSAKLDQQDRSLSVVAEKMGDQSMDGETHLIEMQKNIFGLSELIGKLNFNIISSKLQAEMTKHFLEEINGPDTETSDQLITQSKALGLLYDAFIPKIDSISSNLGKLPEALKHLLTGVREIERFLLVLRFIHIKGKVEIARMNDESNSFSNTFQELIDEVNSAEQRLEKLGDIIRTHEKTGTLYAGYKGKLTELGARLKNYRKEHSEEDLNQTLLVGEEAA
ncbi:PAS domain-containing protein [Rhodohalobacter sp. 8-1]|uniref:PAS domain-containing protein n=1 Tax=Rhodohalobacter sp. 8-1 TaxID=3131972 RepID=UPI0030ED1846